MTPTRVHQHVRAPRAVVDRLLLDPAAVARWRVPDGMTAQVHLWEPWEGGGVRVSLTYEAAGAVGKTAARTDTYRGHFVRLVPGELVVEVDAFETADPALRGEMTATYSLPDAPDGATEVVGAHEGLPPGVDPGQNAEGWRMALARLAALAEAPAEADVAATRP